MSGQGFDDLDDVARATHSAMKVKYLKSDVKKNLQGKITFTDVTRSYSSKKLLSASDILLT